MNQKEILLKLQEKYTHLIQSKLYGEKFIDLSLPLVIDSGACIEMTIYRKEDKIIFINSLFKDVEEFISEYTNSQNIKKEYFLDEDKFSSLVKTVLNDNGIEHSLNLKKKINYTEDYEELIFEIFNYAFNVSRYYNYIINYSIIYSRDESQVKALKNAMKNYVDNFNKKNNNNQIIKVSKEDLLYAHNDYYKLEKTIVSGIGTKLALHQAIDEIEGMLGSEESDKAVILIKKSEKNELITYIDKKNKKNKENKSLIEYKLIDDFEQIEKEFILIKEFYGVQ